MSLDTFPDAVTEPELVQTIVRLLGTGAAIPTVVLGRGLVATRNGVGNYTLTWSENPGNFAGLTWGTDATTVANMAGVTVSGTWTAATNTLVVAVYSGGTTPAARELAATEYVNLIVAFKRCALGI